LLYVELASLYVLPNRRGKGIGDALVQELLSRHDSKGSNGPTKNTEVVLLTLRPTTPLYEKYGFEIVNESEIPASLQFEYKAGSIVSAFLGNDLVCMKRTSPSK
jgi:GNAT superfamily N-acetyltransferase